jgi:hypothetical protein
MASKGARPSDGESRVSNPLDTVSLLEIGLYLCITLQRFQDLTGAFQIHILFVVRTSSQRAENHSIPWAIRI